MREFTTYSYKNLIILFSVVGTLYGGVTGKITGRVISGTTGEPLIGANVILKETHLGDATREDGTFIIINVEGGRYIVIATMIGYATVEIKDVVVISDHTTQVTVKMSPATIEGEEVTITADRPVIVKDETASSTSILAEELQNMPVNSFEDILTTTAGVVNAKSGGDQGIHIRGGRSNEIAYMVDGVMVKDAIYGGMGTDVSRAAIQELSVITGGFNAEYGEAMSGVVNILTKEGTSDFDATFRAVDDGLSNLDNSIYDWNTKRYEGTMSGPVPIPFLPKNFLTFFFSRDYQFTNTYLGKTKLRKDFITAEGDTMADLYDQDDDNDTTDLLVKGFIHKNKTFNEETRTNAKVVITPIPQIKISLSALLNNGVSRGYDIDYKLFQENNGKWWDDSQLYNITINHSLSKNTFYNIRYSTFNRTRRNGLDQYTNKKKDIWNNRDVSKINQYWNAGEPYYDSNGNGLFDWNVLEDDANGNGVWDRGEGEFFTDLDNDGLLSTHYFDTGEDGEAAENFIDTNSNGTWDSDENFTDGNGDGIWNGPDAGEWDGQPNVGEPGVVGLWWSFNAEPYLDTPDGAYLNGSNDILVYDASGNGEYDPEEGDYFIDLSGDGVRREGEPFVDLDGNGNYNYGIAPQVSGPAFDYESNYEFWGEYSLYDVYGNFWRKDTSEYNFYQRYVSKYTSFDGSLTSQFTSQHQIKLGFEIKNFLLENFEGNYLDGGLWGTASYPYYITWKREPKQVNVYLQDKIEYNDWIINLGLRYEKIDPSSNYADPTRKIVYRDANGNFTKANSKGEAFNDQGDGQWDDGEFYIDGDENGQYTSGEIFTDIGNGSWDEGEPYADDNSDGIWTGPVAEYGYLDENGNFDPPPKSNVKERFMPRIGVAYPITDRVKFHFNYGHFLQYPEYKNMYDYINEGDPSVYYNSLYPFPYSLYQLYIPTVGNPNVKPEITVAYETGLHWWLTPEFVVKTTLFYKDMYDYHTSVIFTADPTDYALFLNGDYGNARGFEINLKKLFSNNYSFNITYTYSRAVGNAMNEYTHWYEQYLASVYGTHPSLKTIVLDWDQPHSLNFTVDYDHPKGFGINLLGQMASGLPYTPTDIRGLQLSESNSGRKPFTSNVDMKVYQDFDFRFGRARLFADITNVFNKENVVLVFSNSGQADETLNPNTTVEYEDRPYYFGPRRHIEAGIEILFQ